MARLASRLRLRLVAGVIVTVQVNPAGLWWAAAPEQQWPEPLPENAELLADIRREFDGPHGDRRQEIVFIGIDMDRPVIESLLEDCLLTDEELELGPAVWAQFDDPLPQVEWENAESVPGGPGGA